MVGWHHRLNGHEFDQTLGDGGGQGGLACCGPWGHKESGMSRRQQCGSAEQRREPDDESARVWVTQLLQDR